MKLIVKTDYSTTTTEHNYFDDASLQLCKIRDSEGIGGREFHYAKLFDDEGKEFAHISYNGRVWEGTAREWTAETKEIPR